MTISISYVSVLDRPRAATKHSAGYDLMVSETKLIKSGEVVKFCTDLQIEIPVQYCGLILPRSSLHQLGNGCCLANSVGLIDPDYRGQIKLAILNPIGPQTARIESGTRVAQIIFVPFTSVEWLRVTSLSETDRGQGGFGSTGT